MKKIIFIILSIIPVLLSGQNVYYVATDGNDANAGTIGSPWATLQKSFNVSQPGDTTYIRGGVYYITSSQSIDSEAYPTPIGMSGTAANPIHYFNYPGENPIFDGSGIETLYPAGININRVQYIKFRGITVRNVFQNTIHRDPAELAIGWSMGNTANITFERCTAHDINGRGWSLVPGSGAWNEWDGSEAPFDYDTTIWINCDAYNLVDSLSSSPGNGADGWKTHHYHGNVFTWEGCRAWNYSDDGFDPSGNGYRYFYNNWAMSSAKYQELSEVWDIEGNGYKIFAPSSDFIYPELLDDTIFTKFVNNIAVFCVGAGIDNDAGMWHGTREWTNALVYNNLSYHNREAFMSGYWDESEGDLITVWNPAEYKNNLAYASTSETYFVQMFRQNYVHENSNTWLPTGGWPGWAYNTAFTLNNAAFTSLDSMTIVNEMTAPRKADGSLPDITWARLASDSDMKNAGSDVRMSPNPDIGVDWEWLDAGMGMPESPVLPPALSKGKGLSSKRSIMVGGKRLIW